MTKLVIQIPCFNEEDTLPSVFEKMPKVIPGIDEIEFQIIDDGSTDQTVAIAKKLGVQHIVSVSRRNRRWLGRAFKAGVDHALKVGADILVNTDGDNQYPSERIPDLVKPILENKADIVIGNRHPENFYEFSAIKKKLQLLGNKTITFLTGEPIPDAVSGFRAYHRDALLKIHNYTNYTYTVDTLIQAYKKGLDVAWIDIVPNPKTRDSRLITSLVNKVKKSGATILRLVTLYEPFKTFLWLSGIFFVPGVLLLMRFLYYYLFVPGRGSGFIQSVVVGSIMIVIAMQMFLLGIIGDLLNANRRLSEDILTRVRELELNKDNSGK
ncbi:MAG: glycosyltransferase family 2 protein [Deltaproteobacteria bacterium]|nr:glycosyltransferase family 2 protein [Deltaproteobacteria bacterium]